MGRNWEADIDAALEASGQMERGESSKAGETIMDYNGNKKWVPKRAPPTCRQKGGKKGRTFFRQLGMFLFFPGCIFVMYNVMVRGVIFDTTDMVSSAGLLAVTLGIVFPVLTLCFCRDHITADERMEMRIKRRAEKRQKHKEQVFVEDMRNPLRQANAAWLKQHQTGKLTCLQHMYWYLRLRLFCGVRLRFRDHPAHFLPYIDLFAKIGVFKRRHIVHFVNAFLRMDDDRSGTVDVEEFLEWINYDANVQFTASIFQSFDTDKSGELEFPEWVIALVNFCLASEKFYSEQIYDTYAKSKYGGKTVMRSRDTDAMILEMFGERGLESAKEEKFRSRAPRDSLFLTRKKLLQAGMNYSVDVGVLKKQFMGIADAHPVITSKIRDLAFKITLMVGGARLWDGIKKTKEDTMNRMGMDQIYFDKLVLQVLDECAVRRKELVDLDKRHRNIVDPPPPRKETKQEKLERREVERQMKQMERQKSKKKAAEAAERTVKLKGGLVEVGELVMVRKDVAAPDDGWRGVLPGKSVGTLMSMAINYGQPTEERGCIVHFPEPLGQWAASLGHVEKYVPPRVQLAPIGHLRKGVSDRPQHVRFGLEDAGLFENSQATLDSGASTHTLNCARAYSEWEQTLMDLKNQVAENHDRLVQENTWMKLQAIPSRMIPEMIKQMKGMKKARRLGRRQMSSAYDKRMVRHSMMTKEEIEKEKELGNSRRHLKQAILPVSKHAVKLSPGLARAHPQFARPSGVDETKDDGKSGSEQLSMQDKFNRMQAKAASEKEHAEPLDWEQMGRLDRIRASALEKSHALGKEQYRLKQLAKLNPNEGLTPEEIEEKVQREQLLAKRKAEGLVPNPEHAFCVSYLDSAPLDHEQDHDRVKEYIAEKQEEERVRRAGQISPFAAAAHRRAAKRLAAISRRIPSKDTFRSDAPVAPLKETQGGGEEEEKNGGGGEGDESGGGGGGGDGGSVALVVAVSGEGDGEGGQGDQEEEEEVHGQEEEQEELLMLEAPANRTAHESNSAQDRAGEHGINKELLSEEAKHHQGELEEVGHFEWGVVRRVHLSGTEGNAGGSMAKPATKRVGSWRSMETLLLRRNRS